MFSEEKYQEAAEILGCEIATIKAVSEIESGGRGFTDAGRLMVLFEGHWFSKYTKGKYDKQYPTISYRKFTKAFYKKDYDDEYVQRFSVAFKLDATAAMLSTSFGAFQIMGFQYKELGFKNVGEMVDYLKDNIDNHLALFVKLINGSIALKRHMQRKEWAAFAYLYNGSQYEKNKYDIRLAAAYKKFKNEDKGRIA